MCRFVAYLGKKPLLLNDVLGEPENSLINQSKHAKDGALGLNADGFGLGWYNHEIDNIPGVFKSIQPAWNDLNLHNIVTKVKSTCFLGHVRSATMGDVNIFNSHPFAYNKFLFVHNGTIHEFDNIKRQLLTILSDEMFSTIKGQTDSEYLFALLMDNFYRKKIMVSVQDLSEIVEKSIDQLIMMQKQLTKAAFSKINSVLTNGKTLIATRYVSDDIHPSLSLYYSVQKSIKDGDKHVESIIISSEPLTDCVNKWIEIPPNHMFLVDETLNFTLKPIVLAHEKIMR